MDTAVSIFVTASIAILALVIGFLVNTAIQLLNKKNELQIEINYLNKQLKNKYSKKNADKQKKQEIIDHREYLNYKKKHIKMPTKTTNLLIIMFGVFVVNTAYPASLFIDNIADEQKIPYLRYVFFFIVSMCVLFLYIFNIVYSVRPEQNENYAKEKKIGETFSHSKKRIKKRLSKILKTPKDK